MDLAWEQYREPGRRLSGAVRPALAVLGLMTLALLTAALVWYLAGPNPLSQRVFGIPNSPAASIPTKVLVVLAPATPMFSPRAAVVSTGGTLTFVDQSSTPLVIRSAALSPAQFVLRIPGGGQGSVRLTHPGLYHFYDALTARPLRVVANSEVIARTRGSGPPTEGWVAVLPALPSLRAHLIVPSNQDLFTPKALAAVVGSTIVVSNHDTDAHNFVVDPASPSGAAFIVDGTNREPGHGWQRSLIVQQPGVYHVYCTLHTRVIGVVDGWHTVAPRPKASGYPDRNPMESWVIALPATTGQ